MTDAQKQSKEFQETFSMVQELIEISKESIIIGTPIRQVRVETLGKLVRRVHKIESYLQQEGII